jgi:hypothetical protein
MSLLILMLIPKADRIEVSSITAILAGTMMTLVALVAVPYISTIIAPSVAFAASDNHHYNKQHNTDHHQGLGVYIHNDASYVKNIKINDVDRHSPHLLKVTLIRNNYDGNTPNYISVVALGNEDKHLAGSITISSHFTDQKTVTIHLLKKNGHNANIDNSNDVTVFVVPATLSIHH